jgi:solute carrier family 25 protein 34/35
MTEAIKHISKNHGVLGLWRGMSSAIPRISVSSAVQLLTFEKSLEFIRAKRIFHERSWGNACFASLISGVFVAVSMAPFDLIATRFYNQGVDSRGKGLLYRSVVDCTKKIYLEEGIVGFFKGWTANWFRLGPHTLLLLVFWDQLKYYHLLYEENKTNGKEISSMVASLPPELE